MRISVFYPYYGVRTLAFDTQPHGTPNWWLDYHNVTETNDAGDGVPAWQKYVMDTDPNVAGDFLRITSINNVPMTNFVTFTPASTRRYYTLRRSEDMMTGLWSNVVGQVAVTGSGGNQIMHDTNQTERVFDSVNVRITP